MVEYACDHDFFRFYDIEYAMTAMDYATNTGAIVGSLFPAQRKVFQSRENPVDTPLIGSGSLVAKPFCTVSVDFSQVSTRRLAKPDLNHAGRDVQQ